MHCSIDELIVTGLEIRGSFGDLFLARGFALPVFFGFWVWHVSLEDKLRLSIVVWLISSTGDFGFCL